MENKLSKEKLSNVIDSLKYRRENKSLDYGYINRCLGYIEAYLDSFGILETEKINGIVRVKLLKYKDERWWRVDKKENIEQSLIRQAKKHLE